MSHTEHTQETAIVLRSTVRTYPNEVALIWAGIKSVRCLHQEYSLGPWCFRDPVYLSITDEWFCAEHAPEIMEEDAEYIAKAKRELEAGQRRLRALGRAAPLPALHADGCASSGGEATAAHSCSC